MPPGNAKHGHCKMPDRACPRLGKSRLEVKLKPSVLWRRLHPQLPVDAGVFLQQSALYNNLIEEVQMTLRPVKPPRKEPR